VKKLLIFITLFLFNFNILAKQSKPSFERMLKIESYRKFPYDDLTGKRITYRNCLRNDYKGTPTVGYGTVLKKCKKWIYVRGISKYVARKWARNHPVRKEVNWRIKRLKMDLSQDQEDALHEAGYNLGGTQLGRVLKTLKKHGFNASADHLMKFTRSKGKLLRGLVKRRKDEAERLRNVINEPIRVIKEVE